MTSRRAMMRCFWPIVILMSIFVQLSGKSFGRVSSIRSYENTLHIIATQDEQTDDIESNVPDPSRSDGNSKQFTRSSKPGGASIQFMITKRMRRVLEDELNYLSDEVDIMDPQIAAIVIERGLSRPSAGMPKKWIKYQQSPPQIPKFIVNVKKSVGFVLHFAFRRVLPVALPIALCFLGIPKLLELLPSDTSADRFSEKPASVSRWSSASKREPQGSSQGLKSQRTKLNTSSGSQDKKAKAVDIRSLNKIVQQASKIFNR